MNIEDVKIGMRVIPTTKLGDELYGVVYERAKNNDQSYLYVVDIRQDYFGFDLVYILNDKNYSDSGDFYVASDFEIDIKYDRKKKINNIFLNKYDNR